MRPHRTIALLAACLPGSAFACTLCHSPTAGQVRAAIFGPELLANAAAVLAPVPALLAGWWLLTGGPRAR